MVRIDTVWKRPLLIGSSILLANNDRHTIQRITTSREIKNLTSKSSSHRISEAINSYSSESEIRYVGGCIRKIIKNERVDDIDLATNLEPKQICDALSKKDIKYYETKLIKNSSGKVILPKGKR